MTRLNYETVSQYWSTANASILGPYMMDGFGFPSSAGRFRFRAECKIVDQLIQDANANGCVLDLGSGIGFWTEYFSQRFSQVIAVEASPPLFQALEERCVSYQNVKLIQGDVLCFQPEDEYDVIFLGGMLMYLNEEDVISLMRKIIPCLQPGGIVLCRESTNQLGASIRQGEYQAVYRSVGDYERIFAKCGLSKQTIRINSPYVVMQMGCEFIKKWKSIIPRPLQCLPLVGRLVYWGLRLGYPWITRVPMALGINYPKLTNHFFVFQSTDEQMPSSDARNHAA
jgi:trans-aconitate methyltransferase